MSIETKGRSVSNFWAQGLIYTHSLRYEPSSGHSEWNLRTRGLSGAPTLDIHLRFRYSYSQSSYVLQVSQAIALYPPIRAKPSQTGEPEGVRGGGIAAQAALWRQSCYRVESQL